MTTIDELLGWDPAALGTAAEGLNADRKALVDLQDEMDAGRPPTTWQGQAATAAGESHDKLYDRLADLVAAVSPVVGALDTAQADISAAQEAVRSAKSTISGEGWILQESGGSVTVSAPPASGGSGGGVLGAVDKAADQARMTALAQQIADALQQADDADTQLASVLRGAKTGRYDAGDGTLANAALPPNLRGLTDQQLVDYLVKHPDRDFDLEALSTEQQQLLGQTIADKYSSYADGHPVDDWMFKGEEPPTADDIRTLNSLLAAYGDDDTVATSLLTELGPEGMLHVQQTMLAAVPPLGDDADVVGESQRLWGQTLAAGTHGLDDGGGSSTEHVSTDWMDGLVQAAGKGGLSVDGYGIDDTYKISMNGYDPKGFQLLAPLLRDDGHGSQFLNTVGDAMEDYEKKFVEENGTSPWHGPLIDIRALDLTDGVPDDWSDPRDIEHATGYDPMGGLMEGLSHNPDAARDFLDGGDGDRVDYYLNDREWPHGEGTAYPDLPSEREYFGDALLSATTKDIPSGDTVAAHLAEQAVSGAGRDDVDLAPELRNDFGHMLGHYMPSVYDTFQHDHPLSSGDADPWLPGAQETNFLADFDERELRNTLDDVGRSEHAGTIVADAAAQYANLGYDHVFSGEGQSPEAAAQDDLSQWNSRLTMADSRVSSPYSDVLASLNGGYGDQLRADGLADDAANSARGDAAWEFGGWVAEQGVGKIPVVGSFGEYLVGQGVDAITAANDVDTTAQVNHHIGQSIYDTDGAAQAMAQNAVYRNLPVDTLDPALVDSDGHRIPMSEWGADQRDAWQRQQDVSGVPATASQLREQMSDQMSDALSRRDQFYGHTGDQQQSNDEDG